MAQALAAAGVAALYGALFAAVALYEMISKVAAGGGAAALTAFAIGLSLRHGILVAALAFVGGFVSPAIIGSETPNTPVLFGYLLAIAAGTLGVIRVRGWWPLGWGVLAGIGDLDGGLDAVRTRADCTGSVCSWSRWPACSCGRPGGAWAKARTRRPMSLPWSGPRSASTGVLLVASSSRTRAGRTSAGWRWRRTASASTRSAAGRRASSMSRRWRRVLSIAALAAWWASTRGMGAPWDAARFAWLAILLGGLYAAGAFALLWNAARPGFWAALSVAAALAHFLFCWYVLRSVASGTPWGLISIGLAVPFLVGAERLARWRETHDRRHRGAGFVAAGVVFFIAAAIPLELSRQWITSAYAIEFAAVAAIAARLDLLAMRQLCWPLLAVVVVRFVLNPEVLRYPLGVTPIFNWMLWAYGLSIAALLVGLRFLRPTGDERLVRATEAAVALLAFVLVTIEVRSVFQPNSMLVPGAGFMERTFYVLVWGAFALAALWLARTRRDPVALWAWRASGALALATVLLVQVFIANPIAEKADVGRLPIANGLLLAYAVPAAMVALARRWIDIEPDRNVALVVEAAASILAFVYVSLEVRHLFDPGFERAGFGADGLELYTYSIVWLLFGVALLAVGFLRGAAALRHAGMALVCVVVAKVFLIDMAGLQGLLRVFSFLGLGAALVGLGYAYRRFGFDEGRRTQS